MPEVRFADDLGRIPRIIRLCKVPAPDAAEAESEVRHLAFLASNLPHGWMTMCGRFTFLDAGRIRETATHPAFPASPAMTMARSQLTPRQLKFIEGILLGKVPKDAYIQAGYKGRGATAHSAANRMLKNVEISAFIESANLKAIAQAELSAELVLRRLMEIGSGKGKSALRALELLGKYLKLW